MQKRFPMIVVTVVAVVICVGLALAAQAPKSTKIGKDQCLGCHGPFEKIAKATENFKTPAGDTSTPHRYVPHDSQDVPECTECHIQHPIPPKDKSEVEKPKDVQFCYDGCHHMKNLQSCKTCH